MRQRAYLLDQLTGLVIFSTDRPGHETIPENLVAILTAPHAYDHEGGSGTWDGATETAHTIRPRHAGYFPWTLPSATPPARVAAHIAARFDQDAVLLHDPAPYGPFGRGVWRLVDAAGADLAKPAAFESVEFIPPESTENHTTLTLGTAGPVSFRVPFAF